MSEPAVKEVEEEEKPDTFEGVSDEVLENASRAFHGITYDERDSPKGDLKDPETISDERYLESLSEHPGLEIWYKKRLIPRYRLALEGLRLVTAENLQREQGKVDALAELIKSLEFNRKTSMLFNEEKLK